LSGIRVKNVVRELHNEKIDIIPFAQDPVELLQNALSPIEIRKVSISEEDNTISIVIEDDDFAAVIGKKGMNARLNSQLIGYELEVQRISDYKKTMTLQLNELASSEDPELDAELTSIEGVNNMILEHLAAEGFNTPRTLLMASTEQLAKLPGISLEMADKILEQIRKQRM
jgi:N utilization substance protein A